MLSRYITETQQFLNDAQGQFFNLPTMTNYVNRARRRVAAASGCLRVLPKGTSTKKNQEVYPFSDWKALVQAEMTGVQSILSCRSVAMAIGKGGWKPMWRRVVFTDFQARFRIYNGTFMGAISEPGWWAQYGEGPDAKLYLAPIPSMEMPIDVDLTCIPTPLVTDDDPEPIPYPWTDAVPYWSATLCLLQQQRADDAKAMALLFNTELPMCASVVCPQFIANAYGATLRSA
jgi:hypothetical protein